jgi:LacI family transcriptional regulator
MAKGQWTITQIAEQLGLSTCTVSRVLNNTPNSRISETTQMRVREEIKRLGYQPNMSARALVTGKTHVIGAMIVNSNNPFTGGFIYAMEEVVGDAGYNVLLCNTRGDIERERNEINMLRQRGVEGLIIEHVGNPEILVSLADEEYPFILLAERPDAPELDYVTFDDAAGGRMATQALIQAGCRRIAHIASPEWVPCNRLVGYKMALREAGLSEDPQLVIRVEKQESREIGRKAMERLLDLPNRPDGVFCVDDYLAWGAYEAIQTRGLKVPDDIAMVGYNDENFCPFISLSSIQLDTERLGREAAKALLEKIEKGVKNVPFHGIKVMPKLIRRQSLGS